MVSTETLIGLIMSIISVASLNSWNHFSDPCDFVEHTTSNLSDFVVVFAHIERSTTRKHFNGTSALKQSIENEAARKDKEAIKVISTFYHCYGASGGLNVKHLTFKKNHTSGTCQLAERNYSDYKPFATKKVRVILSPSLNASCSLKNIREEIFNTISIDSFKTSMKVMELCGHHCFKNSNSSLTHDVIQLTSESLFYENLELRVNSLGSNVSGNYSIENLKQKYIYLAAVPRTNFNAWPAFILVCLVILFFFLSLVLCCCGLVMYTLVEEDFRHRNEEREWLAMQLRREEPMVGNFTSSPLAECVMMTARSESCVSTARSKPSDSQSSVATASTQDSETISGSSDNEVETAKTG